ncbi:MAG: thioredoxin [Glaciihabitans sp.]|jgi:thiol-disulfide isomerase/thioredoxin|nr:thioredoxin [Glaciihabitans sp.]
MNPVLVAAILLALIAFTTALGLVWRARTGRVRHIDAGTRQQTVNLPEVPIAGRATLLQFSTEVCAPCIPTRRVLGQIADTTDGVSHIDLDLTHRPDLAAQFNVLQTPTTLILDRAGVIRARIGGAPRPADVRAALHNILAA